MAPSSGEGVTPVGEGRPESPRDEAHYAAAGQPQEER
jgi:hypothetical protein